MLFISVLFLYLFIVSAASNASPLVTSAEFSISGQTVTARKVPAESNWHEPVFSPDGRRIAYVRRPTSLWVANADGSNQTLLYTLSLPWNIMAYPSWSPDGKKIAYTAGIGMAQTGVWYVDIETGQATRILANYKLDNLFITKCAWSPDGKKIAVNVPQGDTFSLVILDLSSNTTTELNPELAELNFPNWAPDGGHILVTGDQHDAGSFWLIPTDGGSAIPLNTNGVKGGFGHFSPDGSWFAFQTWAQVNGNEEWGQGISVVDSRGGTPVEVVAKSMFGGDITFERALAPTWAPDSRHLLVELRAVRDSATAAKARNIPLAVVDTSGKNYKILVDGDPDLRIRSRVSWSPDEQTILYTQATKDDTTVRSIGVLSGKSKDVTAGRDPTWSPYGDEIAFSRNGNIWSRNMQTGAESQITLNRTNATHPGWSPTGEFIAFKQDREIWLVSAYGGEASRLAEFAGFINWAADGSKLYGHSNKSNDYEGIWGDVWSYPLSDQPDSGHTWGGCEGHAAFVAAKGNFVVSCRWTRGSGLILQNPTEKQGKVFFDSQDSRKPIVPIVSPSGTRVAFFLRDAPDSRVWTLDLGNLLDAKRVLP